MLRLCPKLYTLKVTDVSGDRGERMLYYMYLTRLQHEDGGGEIKGEAVGWKEVERRRSDVCLCGVAQRVHGDQMSKGAWGLQGVNHKGVELGVVLGTPCSSLR